MSNLEITLLSLYGLLATVYLVTGAVKLYQDWHEPSYKELTVAQIELEAKLKAKEEEITTSTMALWKTSDDPPLYTKMTLENLQVKFKQLIEESLMEASGKVPVHPSLHSAHNLPQVQPKENRKARLHLSYPFLKTLFALPDNIFLHHMTVDQNADSFCLILESDQFPITPTGAMLPNVEVEGENCPVCDAPVLKSFKVEGVKGDVENIENTVNTPENLLDMIFSHGNPPCECGHNLVYHTHPKGGFVDCQWIGDCSVKCSCSEFSTSGQALKKGNYEY